jgi:hypothetical protein
MHESNYYGSFGGDFDSRLLSLRGLVANTLLDDQLVMKRIWPFIYVAAAILCVIGGYCSLAPKRTAGTNADWIFVTITLVFSSLMPLGTMAYSRRCGIETFRRPSLDRAPIDWKCDPLQSMRATYIGMTFCLVGAGFALTTTDHKGIMLFWFYAAFVVGLFIGERIVYLTYTKRIV